MSGLLPARRSPREFPGTCKLQCDLEAELLTLFNCDRRITDCKGSVRCLEEVAVDRILVIDDYFSKRRNVEPLKLTDRKRLDLDELPLVRKFQNGRPFSNTCFVEGVFSESSALVGELIVKTANIRIIENPKEALEIDMKYILEDQRAVIRKTLRDFARW
jgi:hypothetical protein